MNEFSAIETEEYQEESPLDKLKENLPAIIGLIVLLIMGYFAYNYFIGSNVDASFSIKDISGNNLTNNSLRISDSANKEVFKASGKSIYEVKLKTGEYKIAVSSSDFPLYADTITVDQENASFDVVLKKQYKLELALNVQNSKLIKGMDNEIEAIVTNKGEEDISGLALTISASNAGVAIESPKDILAVAGNQTKIKAIVKIQQTIKISPEEKNAGITLTIKVNGTNISKEIKGIFIADKPVLDIEPVNFKISLNANETKTQEIKLLNKSTSAIPGITLEILLDDTSANLIDDVVNWVYFTSPGKTSDIQELLPESQQRSKTITVNIPKQAKIETINGRIKISTAKEIGIEKEIPFTIEIKKGVEVKLNAEFEVDVFNLSFDGNKYPSQTKKINVTNQSDVDIETPISFNVSNKGDCTEEWFKFESGNNIKSLKKGEKNSNLYYTISAPKEINELENSDDKKMFCKITMSFKDPIDEKTEVQEYTIFINAGS
ncbi:MAG: hypothetical protein AABW72_04265 [archaeon]